MQLTLQLELLPPCTSKHFVHGEVPMEIEGSRQQLCSKNNLELPAVLNGLQIEVPLMEASLPDHISCNDQAKKCFLHHTNIQV